MSDPVKEAFSFLDEPTGQVDLRGGPRARRSPIGAAVAGGCIASAVACGGLMIAHARGLIGVARPEPRPTASVEEPAGPRLTSKIDPAPKVEVAEAPKPAPAVGEEATIPRLVEPPKGNVEAFALAAPPAADDPPPRPGGGLFGDGGSSEPMTPARKKSARLFPSERGPEEKVEVARSALDEARDKFLARCEELDKGFFGEIARQRDEASKAGDTQKVARLDKQRESIEKFGELDGPVSPAEYRKARDRARSDLEFVYRKAEADLKAAYKLDDAKSVWQEFVDLTANSPADRSLRARGLFRNGKYYVDPAPEESVVRQYDDSKRKYASMESVMNTIGEVIDNDRMILRLLDHWELLTAEIRKREIVRDGLPMVPKNRQRREALDAEIQQLRVGPVPSPDDITIGRADTIKELDIRFNRAPSPPRRREIVESFKEAKGFYVQSLQGLRDVVNAMNTRYKEFDHDNEVKDLLAGLKLKLGPSDRPLQITKTLAKAERDIRKLDPTVQMAKAVPTDRRKRR